MKIATYIAILVSLLTVAEAGHGGRGGDVKPKSSGGKQNGGKSGTNIVKPVMKNGAGGKGPQAKGGNSGPAAGGGPASAGVGSQAEVINEVCMGGSTCSYGPVSEGSQSGGYARTGGGTSTSNTQAKGNGGSPSITGSGNTRGLKTGRGGSNNGANGGPASANNAQAGKGGDNPFGLTLAPSVSVPLVPRNAEPSAGANSYEFFRRSAYARTMDEMDSASGLEPVTQEDMVAFAQLLLTSSEAEDDFVDGMNTNFRLYENMAELDPTIKPQGYITAKEITKVVQLLAESPAAQDAVKDSINENPLLARYLADFRAQHDQHQGEIQARGLGLSSWDDVYGMATLRRRWDAIHMRKRWAAAFDEFGSGMIQASS